MNDFQTNRRALLTAGGGMILLTGCEGLDFSAAGEGTGVQIIGAVVVLARYRASPQQKAVAEKRIRYIFVEAAKPEYEKRRAAIEKESQKQIATVERDHARHRAEGSGGGATSLADGTSSGSTHTAGGTNSGARRAADAANRSVPSAPVKIGSAMAVQERRKLEEIERVKAETAAKLMAVDSAWRSLGGTVGPAIKMPETAAAPTMPSASTRDREALIASANAHLPALLAIPVPKQSSEGKAEVMLWDTRNQRFASEDVMVLDRSPAAGSNAKVGAVTAHFPKG